LSGAILGFGRHHKLEPTKREPIRVIIVDSDSQVSRAIVRLLQPADDIEVTATATDETAAIALAVRLAPAVALVDVGDARMDGMEITRTLRQQVPTTRVVMLSVYATFRDQALAAGACRFLLKDSSRDELAAAIRLAARGQCQANEEG
jgi:DNA-binding NarL/FixJ family response regulator